MHEFPRHNSSFDFPNCHAITLHSWRALVRRPLSNCYWLALVGLGLACTPQPQTQPSILADCPSTQPVCQVEVKSVVKAEQQLQELQTTLATQQWSKADRMTTQLFDTIAAQNLADRGSSELPCTDLRTVDRLWTIASQGKFGLRAQRLIWDALNPATQASMHQAVGWSKQTTAPFIKGHFPSFGQRYFTNNLRWFSRHEKVGSDYTLPGPDPTSTSDWCCQYPPVHRLVLCDI